MLTETLSMIKMLWYFVKEADWELGRKQTARTHATQQHKTDSFVSSSPLVLVISIFPSSLYLLQSLFVWLIYSSLKKLPSCFFFFCPSPFFPPVHHFLNRFSLLLIHSVLSSLPAPLPSAAGGRFRGPGGDDLTVDGAQQQHEPDGSKHLGGWYPMRLGDGHIQDRCCHCRGRDKCYHIISREIKCQCKCYCLNTKLCGF